MTDEDRIDREIYLSCWKRAFPLFVGWSEAEIVTWAEWKFKIYDDGWLSHETPIYYLSEELVPESLQTSLSGLEVIELAGRIQEVIEDGDSACDLKPDFDWQAAKERVECVLNEFGETLANIGPPRIPPKANE